MSVPLRILALTISGLLSGAAALASGQDPAPGSPPSVLDVLGVRDAAQLAEAMPVPMRDGAQLIATVVIPNGASASSKRPAILIQTPYRPEMEAGGAVASKLLPRLVREGYVIAIVNDRGTQWSDGEYHWEKGARNDGLDALKWLRSQSWSNGNVGAFGCSSSAEVEFTLATANPPGLKTFVEMAGATGIGVIPGFADQGIFYTGGIPSFDWAWWYHGNGYWHHPKLPLGIGQAERIALVHAFDAESRFGTEDLTWAGHLPSEAILDAIGSPQTEFDRLITMRPNDRGWLDYDFLRTGDRTEVPGLHIDSWYDTIEVYGTTRAFDYLSGNSPNQYLIIGPTAHCRETTESADTEVGQRPVGDARFDYIGTLVRWYDHWLRDEGRGSLDMSRVQYYPLASNRWVASSSWPPAAKSWPLFLSGGRANSLLGNGRLTSRRGADSPADRLVDDPLRPVPTRGGGCCTSDVSLDQTDVEMRSDVLVYTSEPLVEPLDVAGYLSATLYISTTVPDTDLMLKLVDVYPDGKAYNVLDTGERLRYRDGIEHEQLMSPGRVYAVHLRQMVLASHFAPGHRIRIEIAGSNFPEYERNLHTGGENYSETKAVVAINSIYHDRAHPSVLELPVVH